MLGGFLDWTLFQAFARSGGQYFIGEEPLEVTWQKAADFVTAARDRARLLPNNPEPRLEPLPPEFASAFDEALLLKQVSRFGAFTAAMVPLAQLLTPQAEIDADYVASLAAALTMDASPAALVSLAFEPVALGAPLVRDERILFSSHSKNLAIEGPRLLQLAPDRWEICHEVAIRPNFLQIAALPDGKLMVANGIHRVLAAQLAGVKALPALIRHIADPGELGLSDPGACLILAQLWNEGVGSAHVHEFLGASAMPFNRRASMLTLECEMMHRMELFPTSV